MWASTFRKAMTYEDVRGRCRMCIGIFKCQKLISIANCHFSSSAHLMLLNTCATNRVTNGFVDELLSFLQNFMLSKPNTSLVTL